MNQATKFLKDCQTFFIATVEGDQPRVRPFGAVAEFEGKTYFCTNNTKDCFKQMMANPKVEITGVNGGEWIRICGTVKADPRKEAKAIMLEENPSLKNMYNLNDGIFEVLYFDKATATISSFTSEPVLFEI